MRIDLFIQVRFGLNNPRNKGHIFPSLAIVEDVFFLTQSFHKIFKHPNVRPSFF